MASTSVNQGAKGYYIFGYPATLFLAWCGAWLLNDQLRRQFNWTVGVDTAFWILMKIVVWVLPVVLVVRFVERDSVFAFLCFRNLGKGLLWGCATGKTLVAVTALTVTLPSGGEIHPPSFSLVFINAVIVAPFIEEITLRGFLLKRVQMSGGSFWIANTLTAAVFVLMHLPGYYFQRKFLSPATFVRPALSLVALGLLFGWTKHRSGSLYAAIVPHVLNNAYWSLLTQQ